MNAQGHVSKGFDAVRVAFGHVEKLDHEPTLPLASTVVDFDRAGNCVIVVGLARK